MIKFPLELFQKVFIVSNGNVLTRTVSSIRCSDINNPKQSDEVFVTLDERLDRFKFHFDDDADGFWRQNHYNPSIIYYTEEEADRAIKHVYLKQKEELEERLKAIKKKLKNM